MAAVQRKPPTELLQQVRRTVDRYDMLRAGDRVLIAVSGGPDSVALLGTMVALSAEYDIELCVAHLNHQLRGAESLRDQQCAEMAAQRLGFPCVIGTTNGLRGAANLEGRAREQRYAFLENTAQARKCTKIATGHTRDDQAETVLMRLLRGTGCDGLVGIHAVRDGHVIRPLIECSRQQVLGFLQAVGLPFCLDSSNEDRSRVRNRVRHEVIPLLQSISPDVTRKLASTAAIVAGEVRLLDEHVEAIVAPLRSTDGSLALSTLSQAPPELRPRVVRRWLHHQRGNLHGVNADHIRAIVRLARGRRPNARVRLPGRQLVVREYGQLRFHAVEPSPVCERDQWLTPDSIVESPSGWQLTAELLALDGRNFPRPADLWSLVADADVIRLPLLVRTPRPGDRMRPIGLGGQRKLQDIFVDRKLPLDARRSQPVVESDGTILWVPGVARAEHGLITPATRQTLRVVARKTTIAGA
jgi:tRNA(Ile)-lysidine synthase